MTFSFVVPDDGETGLSGKQTVLLRRLRSNYSEHIIANVLVPLIEKSAPISLRALDWLVVNEAKRQSLVCSSTHIGKQTNIFKAYQEALKFWKRRLFRSVPAQVPFGSAFERRRALDYLGPSQLRPLRSRNWHFVLRGVPLGRDRAEHERSRAAPKAESSQNARERGEAQPHGADEDDLAAVRGLQEHGTNLHVIFFLFQRLRLWRLPLFRGTAPGGLYAHITKARKRRYVGFFLYCCM